MAIKVNTVYQTVLMILNKEQRGYMTPTEFNKVATQVQLEIFEDYFDDLNKQLRVPQADTDYADRQENIDEKIAIFKTFGNATYKTVGSLSYFELPTSDVYNVLVDFYRLGNVLYNDEKVVQRLDRREFYYANQSRLTKPSTINPAYLYENQKLFIKPTSIVSKITVDYVRKPVDVNWVIRLGSLGQYEYNDLASVDFELHESEQTEVILKILLYAGIIIRDNEIVQTAAALVQADAQKEVS
jgi:hypothetical protein|tara:strand:- start:491 stop:1216 length:726 start_codon:yes stop_codon:yes gene_type:complete